MRQENEAVFRSLTDEQIMTLTVWGEARGERFDGQTAVATVIMNRAAKWKKSIHDVCLQKNQFSCYLMSDPNFHMLLVLAGDFSHLAMSAKGMLNCLNAVKTAKAGIYDEVKDATFYRVIGNKNTWFDGAVAAGKLVKEAEVGHHEFFREV